MNDLNVVNNSDTKDAVKNVDSQELFPPKEEYLFIRTEILQYLQDYQNVRNMMYIVTATCLGFAVGAEVPNPYFYLLPLLIIMSSFLVAINFWKSVRVDSIYLKVFHEWGGSPFQWKSRHDRLYDNTL